MFLRVIFLSNKLGGLTPPNLLSAIRTVEFLHSSTARGPCRRRDFYFGRRGVIVKSSLVAIGIILDALIQILRCTSITLICCSCTRFELSVFTDCHSVFVPVDTVATAHVGVCSCHMQRGCCGNDESKSCLHTVSFVKDKHIVTFYKFDSQVIILQTN